MKSRASFLTLPTPLIWQSYLLAFLCGSFFSIWPLPSLLFLVLLILSRKKLWKISSLSIALLLFTFSSIFISHKLQSIEKNKDILPVWAENGGPYKGTFCGTITQVQGLADRRVRLVLETLHPANSSPEDSLPMSCSLTREDDDPFFSPLRGQEACFKGTVKKIRHNINTAEDLLNPSGKIRGYLWQAYSNKKSDYFHIGQGGSYLDSLREKLRKKFLNLLGFRQSQPLDKKTWQSPLIQSRAILVALCFGDRRLLSYETGDNFARASIAHSLALSGQHLGTAALMALLIIFCITKWRPGSYNLIPRPGLAVLLSLPLALLYLWIGNAPPSLLRAAAMILLLALYILRGHAFTGMDLVYGTVLLFTIINPLIIFDLGFQLSILCVLVIALYAPALAHINSLLPKISSPFLNRIFRGACGILLISLLIQIFLLPQNLLYFSNAGFYFPINLLWLPVLGIFVLPLAFLSLILSLFPGNFFFSLASSIAQLAALPCEWLLLFLEKLRSWQLLDNHAFLRPHWLYFIILAILAVCLAWLFAGKTSPISRKKSSYFLLFAIALMLIPPTSRLYNSLRQRLDIEVLDVGQGLSVLLKTGGLNLVYDGGGNAYSHFDPGKNILVPAITSGSAPRVDAVFNSHPDMDHLGGLFYLLESFKTGLLFHNGHEAGKGIEQKWQQLIDRLNSHPLFAGDIIYLDGNDLKLEILHPPAISSDLREPDPYWKGNRASLVMRLSKNNEGLVLFTGDAEKETLEHILKSDQPLSARVIIAPHHGSDRSLVKDFYRKVNPDLVLAGCGYQNRWGYPGKKLKKFLAEMKIPLLDTGNHGKIKISFEEKNGMNVSTLAIDGKKDNIFQKIWSFLIFDKEDNIQLPYR